MWVLLDSVQRFSILPPTIMAAKLQPDIFKAESPVLSTLTIHENNLSGLALRRFLDTSTGSPGIIGLAPTYGTSCRLAALSLSTASSVLRVAFSKDRKKTSKSDDWPGRKLLRDFVLCNPAYDKVAFRMDRLVAALWLDVNLGISGAIDLLSCTADERHSIAAFLSVLGGEEMLKKDRLRAMISEEEGAKTKDEDAMVQSWAAYTAAQSLHSKSQLQKGPKIVTNTSPSLVSIPPDPPTFLGLAFLRDASASDSYCGVHPCCLPA